MGSIIGPKHEPLALALQSVFKEGREGFLGNASTLRRHRENLSNPFA